MSDNCSLTPKQESVIEGLVDGLTIIAAAKAANVAERTVHYWLRQPHFQRALQQEQRRVHAFTMMKLLGRVEKAINTLDRNMDSKVPHVQVLAASKILDAAHEQMNVLQLEEEIDAMRDELRRHGIEP